MKMFVMSTEMSVSSFKIILPQIFVTVPHTDHAMWSGKLKKTLEVETLNGKKLKMMLKCSDQTSLSEMEPF